MIGNNGTYMSFKYSRSIITLVFLICCLRSVQAGGGEVAPMMDEERTLGTFDFLEGPIKRSVITFGESMTPYAVRLDFKLSENSPLAGYFVEHYAELIQQAPENDHLMHRERPEKSAHLYPQKALSEDELIFDFSKAPLDIEEMSFAMVNGLITSKGFKDLVFASDIEHDKKLHALAGQIIGSVTTTSSLVYLGAKRSDTTMSVIYGILASSLAGVLKEVRDDIGDGIADYKFDTLGTSIGGIGGSLIFGFEFEI